MQSTPRKITLLIAPVAILISMLFAFSLLTKLLGFKWGYFVAFVLYWLVWGLLFPHWILGVEGLKNIFRSVAAPLAQPALLYFVLLVLPPLLAGITAFRANVSKANLLVFLISAGLALVNGTLEEVLWRGTFITVFSDQLVLGYLYPALGFAVWHLAPQIVHRSSMPGGTVSFILGALFLGLCWGWVAWRTRSIRWTVISHVLTDFMGLGALVYLRG
jgi:hypothetical protein